MADEFVTYLRRTRPADGYDFKPRDTVYAVLGSALRSPDPWHPRVKIPVIWTRTVSGYGHVQNGRIRTWSRTELEASNIVAIPTEEAI